MCCESESHHGGKHRSRYHGPHHGGCCCGGHFHFGPSFWTKAEKITWLERYLEGLRKEMETVQERIAALKEEE